MPKMKHFQGIADVRNRIETTLRESTIPFFAERLEATHGVKPEDVAKLPADIAALDHLLNCQHGFAMSGEPTRLADYTDYERIFTRHHELAKGACDVMKTSGQPTDITRGVKKLYQREMNTCVYYLEKLKDPEYLAKLPKTLLPLDQK